MLGNPKFSSSFAAFLKLCQTLPAFANLCELFQAFSPSSKWFGSRRGLCWNSASHRVSVGILIRIFPHQPILVIIIGIVFIDDDIQWWLSRQVLKCRLRSLPAWSASLPLPPPASCSSWLSSLSSWSSLSWMGEDLPCKGFHITSCRGDWPASGGMDPGTQTGWTTNYSGSSGVHPVGWGVSPAVQMSIFWPNYWLCVSTNIILWCISGSSSKSKRAKSYLSTSHLSP